MVNRNRSKHQPTKSRLRHSLLEKLECRRLLAVDIGAKASDDAHELPLGEYWLPKTRSVAELSGFDTNGSGETNGFVVNPVASAVEYLQQNRSALAASVGDDVEFRVTSSHHDSISDARHVYLQQTFEDLDIVNATANATFSAAGELVSLYSSFVSPLLSSVSFASISPSSALTKLSEHLQLGDLNRSGVSVMDSLAGESTALSAPSISSEAIPYESVFIPNAQGFIDPAWKLNVQLDDGSDWFDSVVSQSEGTVAFVANWTSDARYRVIASPKESPLDGSRSIEVDPNDSGASPFGWHDTNGIGGAEFTITRGNNVHAYTDVDANNVPDPLSEPDGGAGLSFSYPANFQQEPSTYSAASLTNLFYTTNLVGDVLENHGFDEASGNFQETNYGGLGADGDPVLAEGQDGGGLNNANFATPPDGTSPRMQMFLFNQTTPMRDGSFDNGIIAHEFGHGVSNRLTGGAANANALTTIQSRGMGEGWSDFFSLVMTQDPSDQGNDGRGIGTYVLGESSNGPGIRSQKYSYDTSINDHTFSDIVGSGSVHFIGETWATTLWDLTWALIDGKSLDKNLPLPGLGYDPDLHNGSGGNNMAMRLAIQGMKLQPVNPTFIDARDAILAADQLLNAGKYQQTIWNVFARRGMGLGAAAPSGSNSTNVVESFVEPIVGTLQFSKSKPLGSLVSRVTGELPPLVGSEVRELNFFAERDSKIAFNIDPIGNSSLTVEVRKATGAVLVSAVTSTNPGDPVVIPTTRIAGGGNYVVEITSSGSTGVSIDGVRNAVLESEVVDSQGGSRVNLNPSFLALGGGINAVVGHNQLNTETNHYNDAGLFVDISTTGTPLGLADDGEVLVETAIGNALFPAGWTTIGNNGGILHSDSPVTQQLSFSNVSLFNENRNGLFPFWDDIDSDTGDVYYQERSISGVNALIVQWENRPHFSNVGSSTFQLQLFESGPVLARFAYEDVLFGNASYDNGASATIGVVPGDGTVNEFSFNTASVSNGDVIDFIAVRDVDYYTFTGQAGAVVDVILDQLNGTQIKQPIMRLLDPTGTTLIGLATTKPLASRTTVSNYDQGVLSAILPTSGTYQIRVIGEGDYDYTVAVTENVAFDTENSIGTLAPFRTIPLGTATMGFLNGGGNRDLVAVDLVAGQTVRIVGQTPFDHANTIPRNTLGLKINLQAPDLSIVASDQTPNANGVYVINHTATQTGKYRIDLRRLSGSGEYHVRVIDQGSNSSFASPVGSDEDFTEFSGPTVQVTDGSRAEYFEGAEVTLLAEIGDAGRPDGVDGTTSYTWDLDNDGQYDDAVGANASLVLGFIDVEQLKSIRVRAESVQGVSETEYVMSVGLTPWRNRALPTDVNGDGVVTVLDALQVINAIAARGEPTLPKVDQHQTQQPLIDVNGDNQGTALDALLILNELRRNANSASVIPGVNASSGNAENRSQPSEEVFGLGETFVAVSDVTDPFVSSPAIRTETIDIVLDEEDAPHSDWDAESVDSVLTDLNLV